MTGLSSAASVIAVVSVAVQLADSIKKLYEFWNSVQGAPEDVHSIKADLGLLSTVLSDIALDAQQHQLPDAALIGVLEQCTIRVGVLTTSVREINLGFDSKHCSVRKWSAVKMVFKDKKLEKYRVTLERLKTTLSLAQQNHCR